MNYGEIDIFDKAAMNYSSTRMAL